MLTPAATPRTPPSRYTEGCDHVETVAELRERRIGEGRPLRVKLGLDPTSPDLHIGHAVVLRKLQQFVAGGHDVTLVIGSFTARIGDPSGRNALRPRLSDEQIDANMRTYATQAGKVLDLERVEPALQRRVANTADVSSDVIRLLSQTTVARMLDRKDFAARFAQGTPISLHEFLYPVAQAYDSVALSADVELGGTDQLFNLLMGRHYQEREGQSPQICMTTPLLEGLDGKVKMSKSVGNHVAIAEPPADQFGKLMRVPDEMVARYARLGAGWAAAACEELTREVADGRTSPIDAKKRVAEAIVALYNGSTSAKAARENFERTVQRRELPNEMTEITLHDARRLTDVLVQAGFAQSRREAQRLVNGGGVKLDGVVCRPIRAMAWTATGAVVLSVGARRFARVVRRG